MLLYLSCRRKRQGGGIYCQNNIAVIEGNLIQDNFCNTNIGASLPPQIGGDAYAYSLSIGGGIYCSDGNVSIKNNIISGNYCSSFAEAWAPPEWGSYSELIAGEEVSLVIVIQKIIR